MANAKDISKYLDHSFVTVNNENYKDESGLTYDSMKDIKRVGYTTNLTPDIIEDAKEQGYDMIITHHDAWDFIPGLKEESMKLLEKYGISHYYNHLPLDDSEFGTNSSLAKELGLREVKRGCDSDGFKCAIVGEYDEAMSFSDFVNLVEARLGERVQAWNYGTKEIKRVYILCGAGHPTCVMEEAVDEGCDLYLTGEKILYTVEYAQFKKLNLVVGSHTFTELFGVKNMVELLRSEFKDLDLELLHEPHLEVDGFHWRER